jgi:hypothetical protein
MLLNVEDWSEQEADQIRREDDKEEHAACKSDRRNANKILVAKRKGTASRRK